MDEFGFLYDESNLDFTTPNILRDSSPESAQAAEDDPDSEINPTQTTETTRRLPLLRSNDVEPDRVYDRDNPTCIHYDLKWKVLQRGVGKKRSSPVDVLTKRDLVLAPSDLWEEQLERRLTALVGDSDKFSTENNYTCKGGTVTIRAKNTRSGLDEDFDDENIPWSKIDQHLESLGLIFKLRRMPITLTIELTYQETATTTPSGGRQRQSTTQKARAQLAEDSVFMTRVYQHHECRGGSCRQKSMHCLVDEKGNHHGFDNETMRAIYLHIKGNMKEGERYEDVQNIEIPAVFRTKILRASKKRMVNASSNCRSCKSHVAVGGRYVKPLDIPGDPAGLMREYCTSNLLNVQSDRERNAMQAANEFAMEQLLDLNSIYQHPDAVKDAMVANRVPLGCALRFVSGITRFIESRETENEE